jgi:hypothetical protein
VNVVQFVGIDRWVPGSEIVEVVASGRTLDLHNAATLTGVEIPSRPPLELILRFVLDGGRPAELTFGHVTDLLFRQDEADSTSPFAAGWDPAVVETFFGLEYRDLGDGTGWFEVGTILGTLTFVCRTVRFAQ